ncbi:MAG TPA: HAD-IA family hydrolase [Candidatus Acidoferrales bacterium]|nr:HAD-IA family hydrolase [Candidatus Acidoferrales bacterium]
MPRPRSAGSKPRPPAAIIFDIGGVIVRVDPRRVLPILNSKKTLSPEKIWAAIQSDPLWKDWQEGRVTPREWCAHLTRRFGLHVTFDQFCRAWASVLLPHQILPDQLFARLSRRCRLVLLSNTDPLHVEYQLAHFSFLRYFPARVFSCCVGASKPEPKIYQAAIHAAGFHPARVLYVDDILPYVRAGARMGLDAVQFKSPRQLHTALRLRNLI